MPDGSGGKGRAQQGRRITALELVASAMGLVLTVAMLAFIAWEALTRPGDTMPAVTVEPREITAAGGVWVLGFDAVNHTPATAANVEITGTLSRDGREVASSKATLDYVPGRSTAQGGLFFRVDPRGHEIELRAEGYAEP